MSTEILDTYVENYEARGGCMDMATIYCGEIFRRYMNKGSVLELGPAHGVMTNILYPHFNDYTAVDGSNLWMQDLEKRYPNIKCYCSYFEDFTPPPAANYTII